MSAPQPGRVEAAVVADLAHLADGSVPGQGTLTELALRLAATIDGWRADGSAAALSAQAKAHQELRITMARLLEVGGDDDSDAFDARMSTPVRDAPQPGAGDAGAAAG